MKYASQINVVIVVVALVTVGYAVSQTLWKSPFTPSVEITEAGGSEGVSRLEANDAPASAEAELTGRENLRRQVQQPRPPAAFQPNREAAAPPVNRQPASSGQRRLPAGLYPAGGGNPPARGPRVTTMRGGPAPEGADPIREGAGSKRQTESVDRSTDGRRSNPAGPPDRLGQRPGGRALPQGRANAPAGRARRNTQPPPPPSRSSNR